MTIKIGDLDVANEIVELHFQLRKTQKLLEVLINRSPIVGGIINTQDIAAAEADALDYVQKKFPSMGIKKNI